MLPPDIGPGHLSTKLQFPWFWQKIKMFVFWMLTKCVQGSWPRIWCVCLTWESLSHKSWSRAGVGDDWVALLSGDDRMVAIGPSSNTVLAGHWTGLIVASSALIKVRLTYCHWNMKISNVLPAAKSYKSRSWDQVVLWVTFCVFLLFIWHKWP